MGVAGSTQRLRPLVNPDGSIGIKVRNRLGTPRRSPARTLPTSVVPIGPLTSAHRRSHPQINKRLIQKLDGIEDGVPDAPSVRCGPSPSPRSSSRRRDLLSLLSLLNRSGSFPHALVPRAPRAPHNAALIADASIAHPGLENALVRSTQVGQLLLKNERDELDRVRDFASEMHANSYAMKGRDVPCATEREACRLCYETNKSDTLRCGNEVAAYDMCAREAQRSFLEGARGAAVANP